MKIISHRGLLNGPDQFIENRPETILYARSKGFDVEIDLWYHRDSWYLGHDEPTHNVNLDWLRETNRNNINDEHHLWIHTKNIDALYHLQKIRWEGHIFYHQNDDVVVTTTGYLWTFPGKQLTPLSICVLPEVAFSGNLLPCKHLDIWGFCTDYVNELVSIIS
jgi:hypothetical protein